MCCCCCLWMMDHAVVCLLWRGHQAVLFFFVFKYGQLLLCLVCFEGRGHEVVVFLLKDESGSFFFWIWGQEVVVVVVNEEAVRFVVVSSYVLNEESWLCCCLRGWGITHVCFWVEWGIICFCWCLMFAGGASRVVFLLFEGCMQLFLFVDWMRHQRVVCFCFVFFSEGGNRQLFFCFWMGKQEVVFDVCLKGAVVSFVVRVWIMKHFFLFLLF